MELRCLTCFLDAAPTSHPKDRTSKAASVGGTIRSGLIFDFAGFEQNSSRPYQLKERFFPREVGHEFYQHKANDRFGKQKNRFLYSVRRGTQACWDDVGLK
jgi:hypothetical protein